MRSRASLLIGTTCLLACTPRVSANLAASEQPPPVRVEAEPKGRGASEDFDPIAALDASETLLLSLDQFRNGPDRPYPDHDAMESWLENEGLRSMYWYVKQMSRTGMVLDGFQNIFGVPVFVSGPHVGELDYHASEFGHYNPEFVARLTATARALARDPQRVARTREAFDRQLRQQALTYLISYATIHDDPQWFANISGRYADEIASGDVRFEFYEELAPVNEAMDRRGLSWYESDTAAYFWMRREFDGTATQWREAITELLQAYGVETNVTPLAWPRSARP